MRKLYLILSSFFATQATAMNYSDGSFGNYAFLNQSALSKCAERDGRVFTSTLLRALNHAADGSTVEWRNARTGDYGRILVLSDPDGVSACRLARIATTHKNVDRQDLYQFCRKNGKWVAHVR
jgi:surface antigen